jgi:drug/metabolite transporter (DMT)-like permease
LENTKHNKGRKKSYGVDAWTGAMLATAAAIAFACSTTSAKIAYGSGSDAATVACLRFCLPVVVLAAWRRATCLPLVLAPKGVAIASLMGVLTAAFSWALLSAVNVVPIAQAVLVFYFFPILLAIIVVLLRWEKFNFALLVQISLALVGLALALDPRAGNLKSEGLILALAAAFGFAIVIALSSYGARQNDPILLTLYMSGVAASVLMIFLATHSQFRLPASSIGWIGLISSASFYSVGLIACFVSVPLIGPMRVSLLLYGEPLATAVLGALFLGEHLTLFQVAGMALTVSTLASVTVATSRTPNKQGESLR